MEKLEKLIYKKRKEDQVTQDVFGSRYDVSGPAIFKFEKGYVNPSFKLWMRMATDFEIPEAAAVLLWAQAKLPPEYRRVLQDSIDAAATVKPEGKGAKSKAPDLSRIANRDTLRETVLSDKSMPRGLTQMCRDNEIWNIYQPTGREIAILRDTYASYGDGTKAKYREALLALRRFTGRDE